MSAQLPTGENTNPLVLGTFRGNQTKRRRPRVLFYGYAPAFPAHPTLTLPAHSHYDVIAASARGWYSDPFTLTGRNGYLYGRGATDNKGPVMAVACAAAELLARRALDLDLVMLIEGEEEAGSGGFAEAVKRNKVRRCRSREPSGEADLAVERDWPDRRYPREVGGAWLP